MPTAFRSESVGSVKPGEVFSELGIVEHDGKAYASGGGYVSDDRLVAYLGKGEVLIPARIDRWQGRTIRVPEHYGKRGNLQTWNGQTIGRYMITHCWRVPCHYGDYYQMCQVRIVLDDGRTYQGRSQGCGMVVTARRTK